MPRFVILHHDAPAGLHFDLMLERGGVLVTWSLPRSPEPGVDITGQRLADHRLAYLDYEGPVSGGRGTVSRWDHGAYEEVDWGEDRVAVELHGEKLACRATLERVQEEADQWRLVFA